MINAAIGITLSVAIIILFCVIIANLIVSAMPVTFVDDKDEGYDEQT